MPVATDLHPGRIYLEPVAGEQSFDTTEEGLAIHGSHRAEVMRETGKIELIPDGRQGAQRKRHGGKGKPSAGAKPACEVQRAFTRVVAGEEQGLCAFVPAGNGESANQVMDKIEAPTLPGGGQDLIIRHRCGQVQLATESGTIVEPEVPDGHSGRPRWCRGSIRIASHAVVSASQC